MIAQTITSFSCRGDVNSELLPLAFHASGASRFVSFQYLVPCMTEYSIIGSGGDMPLAMSMGRIHYLLGACFIGVGTLYLLPSWASSLVDLPMANKASSSA